MGEAERRALPYLFKLRLTANVKRAIERLSGQSDWVDSGQGWQAKGTEIRLQGWSRQRRVVVLRRRVRGALATPAMDEDGPPRLAFLDIGASEEMWWTYRDCVRHGARPCQSAWLRDSRSDGRGVPEQNLTGRRKRAAFRARPEGNRARGFSGQRRRRLAWPGLDRRRAQHPNYCNAARLLIGMPRSGFASDRSAGNG